MSLPSVKDNGNAIAISQINQLPVETNRSPYAEYSYLFSKRAIDIVGSLFGLIIFSPILLALSIMIIFSDLGGPVFFSQNRIGLKGKMFKIYKFRTMVSNAEERLLSDPELYKKYVENNYKLEPSEDPRITKIGRFLRRTSLDELPQLFNVLKGEMSLVGPRPVVREELEEYKEKTSQFLSVKPGITGYWQVCGRSGVGYPERVDLEIFYVSNQSFIFDIKIILKTIIQVIKRQGAY
ncbi:sugar transferase [Paenibacillus thermotolerans]|uniref:sugar transferase n=1 Tax=Paenibacillus thermotolerans TaxID=3027807 RepID=UPI002368DD7B|nr:MULTISPECIES: sugar transferase [unclassified Paenibacillus]